MPIADQKALFVKLDSLFLPTLRNVTIPHPRLMIWFSGPPSSGKSAVAKSIEQTFQAIRFENDTVRKLLIDHCPDLSFDERNQITYTYGLHVYEQLANTPNGLWIIDSSIDRRADAFYGFAEQHHFAHFLIAMDIPEATHKEWIMAGGDRPYSTAAEYLMRMPQRRQEQRDFLHAHVPDLILQPGYQMQTVIDAVSAKLREI